jgi:hypothetical protein
MAADFTIKYERDRVLLHYAYEFIKNLRPFSELILYQNKEGHPLFIHIAIPVQGRDKYFDVRTHK